MIRLFVVVILSLYSSVSLSVSADKWLIQKIQVEDGLPSATVFSLQQEEKGFLWFGTVNGVARYDGYDFKVFKHDGSDLNTISNNNAGNIYIDSKNTLWVGTFGGGFNTIDLNTEQVTRFPYSSDENANVISGNVQTFHEDRNSHMWIGTPNGLYKFTDKIVKHYKHNEADDNSLVHSRIWDIIDDSSGHIWVGTSQGLSKINPITDEVTNYVLPESLEREISSNEFRNLFLYKDELWIASSSDLFSFNLKNQNFTAYPLKYNIKINDLMLIDDFFLVGTMGGLYQFDLVNRTFLKNEDNEYWLALGNNDIRSILVDQSGLWWFATRDSGIIKINPNGGLFSNHRIVDESGYANELTQRIWAIEFDHEGNSYLGSEDTLFKRTVTGEMIRISIDLKNEIPGRIRALKWDSMHNLWIGTSDGLFVLRSGNINAEIVLEPYEIVGIKPADIFSIEESHDGELWFSLNNLGLLRWNQKNHTAELIQQINGKLITDLNIGKIIEDSNQNLWITTNLIGLIKYNVSEDKMIQYSHDYTNTNSISSNRVSDILEDDNGFIWSATYRGVNTYNPESDSFQVIDVVDGLLDQSVINLVTDLNNNIWAGHNFGVSRIEQSTGEVQNFKINSSIRKDGLSIRAVNISPNNELYYGSINGLYTFDANNIESCIQYKPQFLITEVTINNTPMTATELASHGNKFDLFHQDKEITFNFSVLEFNSPDHVRYSYKISDKDWTDVTTTRSVELSNLQPGAYWLEILAKNSDCRWSEQSLKIQIQVHPLWWNIWWVRLIFIALILLASFLYHYLRSGMIRRRNIELEQLVENRTSELMQLNKKLESASETNFLTGLYNRMGFIHKFNSISSESLHRFIVLADLDEFKNINDDFGHLAGDEVLINTSRIMQKYIKNPNLVARWGGEEFIFYIEQKTPDKVFELIEIIRVEIQNSQVDFSGKGIQVTCTFGICQIKSGMELNDCIKVADNALYLGKSKGRNTTVFSSTSE